MAIRKQDIIAKSQKLKAELIKADEGALSLIEKSYVRSLNRLQDKIDALAEKIDEARKAGELVDISHPSWLPRQERYKALMAQIDDELGRLSGQFAATIESQQTTAAQLGLKHSSILMETSLGPVPDAVTQAGLGVNFNTLNIDAIEKMAGMLADGSPLDYKFAQMADGLKSIVKETMLSDMMQGIGPRQMAANVNRAAMGQMSNVLTTCRTETMRAYRGAADENYAANEDILDGWIWSSAHQSRTCAACWAMDGTLHDNDEPLTDHVCGRCCKIPRTKTWQELFPDLDLSHVKETRVEGWDSATHFGKLSEADQRKVLGGSKYSLYKDGKLQLSDMASTRKSVVWGDSIQQTPISELVRAGKITSKEAAAARVAGSGGNKPPSNKPRKDGGDKEEWRYFTDAEDARRWGDKHFAESSVAYSKQEKESISYYQAHGYRPINNAVLRGKPGNDGEPWTKNQIDTAKKAIPNIDAVISNARLPENVIVWRGAALEDVVKDWSNVVGLKIPDKAFMSASLLESSATKFAHYATDSNKTPLIMEVRARKGINCSYVRNVTGITNKEEELLFARNHILVVKESAIEAGNIHRIVVELKYEH